MTEVTVDDVKRMLLEAAGTDESIDMDDSKIHEASFAELGYDSLAVLELCNRIEQEYGLKVLDGDLSEDQTLQQVVAYVNNGLTKTGL